MLYELFEAALRSAGIHPDDYDPFLDRGDGLLALLHPTGPAPAGLLFTQVVPALGRLLTGYNASYPPAGCAGAADPGRVRRSRLRARCPAARRPGR